MKFRNVALYLAAICVTVLMLFGVRAVQHDLDAQIAKHRLRYTGNIRNAPPLVAVTTVALGSFRGIIADLLWLRADALQKKHSYYEMVQLAQWIADLQPSNSKVMGFLAWNMAYNISVTCSSPIDRWRWVNEGIKLLRDKAIEYNPDDPAVYEELAWFHLHKLGNVLDDAHRYYKNRLAVEMQRVIGRFPDWEKMAEAPAGKEEFLRKYPADAPLWNNITGSDLNEKYDKLCAAFKKSAPELPPELAHADASVLHYLRAELLKERYRLDPKKILALNRKYGTLDWRTPEAQAIYWATESVKRSLANSDEREINTDRTINHALYQSFLSGRVMRTDPDLNKWNGIELIVHPNLSLIDAVYSAYAAGQNYHDRNDAYSSSFRTARNNFLKEAVQILTAFGAFSKAEKYYKMLVDDDGPQKLVIDGKEIAFDNLADYVKAAWVENIKNANSKQADTIISGLIYCCLKNAAMGNHDMAVFYERSARFVCEQYTKKIGANTRMEITMYNLLKQEVLKWCYETMPPDEVRRLKSIIENEQAEQQQQQQQALPPAPGK